jgi:hypothetical protein
MLIEFNVTNFRSIKETQKLSLAATTAKDLRTENTFATEFSQLPRLLKSVVIYGPNASGKSNIINAMRFMRQFVLSSATCYQEGDMIAEVKPFLFNSQTQTQASEFEVLFVQKGGFYQYGFAVNHFRVIHEWLLAYPQKRVQRWFEREYDPASDQENWYFGKKFKGHHQILKESTRHNALFLSTAIQFNNKQLKPVFYWFKEQLRVFEERQDVKQGFELTLNDCKTEAGKQKILTFLKAADLNMADILLKYNHSDRAQVQFAYVNEIQQPVLLNSNEESRGTQKIFNFSSIWLKMLEQGWILWVDELDNSLHPLLVRFLINLLHDPDINKHNAQLIFTTHDTSILESQLLRRDQIWFLEKNRDHATQLYPLSDFMPRQGEIIGKSYLNGRYGALPYIKDLKI